MSAPSSLPVAPVLVLCHHSAAEAAIAIASTEWHAAAAEGSIDLLAYGRSSEELPIPDHINRMQVPALEGSRIKTVARLIRFAVYLRRRRYELGVICQPGLARSRSRGLLLVFPFVAGARRVVLCDPRKRGAPRPVRRRTGAVDFVRWVILRLLSQVLANTATVLLRRAARRAPSAPRPIPADGGVVYLRTDIELAHAPLRAGGSAAHTEGVVAALARRGHDVEFWSTGEVAGVSSRHPTRRLPALARANVPTEIGELVSGLGQALAGWRRPAPSGFVYQRYSLNNLAGLLLARHWRLPLVLEVNNSEVEMRSIWSSLSFPQLARASEEFIFSRCDRATVVSQIGAATVIGAGADPNRLRVVPNGVEVDRFAHAPKGSLHTSGNEFIVCFSGLFYPWHGVRHLAAAFNGLHRECANARLLLLGDGEEAPLVRALLEEGGSLGACDLRGLIPPEQVAGYLACADVLVAPHADWQGFFGSPIKLFEYMAAGKAIVASRVGQIQEIIRHEHNGLLVEPGDEDALLSALRRLEADAALRGRLGEQAQTDARTLHSWDARVQAALDP